MSDRFWRALQATALVSLTSVLVSFCALFTYLMWHFILTGSAP